VFDGVPVGRPATGALIDAEYVLLDDLPEDLDELLALYGVGPKAVRLLRTRAGADRASPRGTRQFRTSVKARCSGDDGCCPVQRQHGSRVQLPC
jgi:hypothetical protein